jgi:ABC-type phosphate/phosphonate transport system substrate-binding protein
MKKMLIMMSIAAMFALVACSNSNTNSTNQQNSKDTSKHIYYTCTMHPEIHSDKPGKCPKCGMELVEREESVKDSSVTK